MQLKLPVDQGPEVFLQAYTESVRPLRVEHARCYWSFATKADNLAYDRLEAIETQLAALHSDPRVFGAIESWRTTDHQDPLISRQLALLYPEYRQGQASPELRARIISSSLSIERTCSQFRARQGQERLDSNELDRRLAHETNDGRRRAAWEATRQIGQKTAAKLLELVELRNQLARELGFSNYYELALDEEEMNVPELFDLLSSIKEATDPIWKQLKLRLDLEFSKLRGKDPQELMPWDYPERFLQSIPRSAQEGSTDRWFPIRAIQKYAKSYYRSIGLPIDRIWTQSDMLPRDGKHPHAFCIGIDNPSEVRVLCNLDSTKRWMETTLHEFGHALYDSGVSNQLPWLLRGPAHTFITEAVAMFFGRLAAQADWLQEVAGVPEELALNCSARLQESQLVFLRWALVVSFFERQLYEQPHSDQDQQWWQLVNEIQGLRRPDNWAGGDWASKVHIACYPAYYQNYILGELLASQFDACIGTASASPASAGQQPGSFFQQLFAAGRRQGWAETVRSYCGEELSPRHWLAQFGQLR
ncbi:MAG: hypothetical protein CMP23_01510 [Rickettsiales bacterium]|nr:hypothetical protein [Rickettsiales bacterium]|tara:strand:- start:4089 stop:5684 length:1596 start_codon:yes stop_codon:yes gene_type:complete